VLTRIAGGRIIDPANGVDRIADLWIRDGRIVEAPSGGAAADETYEAAGTIVMAGGIDIHSHIAGNNVNTARLLLPELRFGTPARPGTTPLSAAGWPAFEIGCGYAAMGFTLVVERAVSPHYALHAHLELADIPIIDKATLSVLGNDDFLLSLIRTGDSASAVRDYVAWTLDAARGVGIKVINAGGSASFKENMRAFSLDDEVPSYGVTSRAIVKTLQQAVTALGIAHPLHVHCNNLGIAGNVDTALATIAAAEGLPLHLAHLQFFSYGTDGPRGFSSSAPRLAEAVNAAANVTIDVGQVMFGKTVTVSLDALRQFRARGGARPRKWAILDGDANGAGVVPYHYRSGDFYNAVQWAAGLELFLLIDDPWRVLFTTDHPNGAPFTAYPEVLALLMSRDLRAEWMAGLPADAVAATTLPSITREYTLAEIAAMTRAAPAKLIGLKDRGHLGPGAVADVAVYENDRDRARMFRSAALVFKSGVLAVRDGVPVSHDFGRALRIMPERDRAIDRRLKSYYDERFGLSDDLIKVPESALGRPEPFELVPCRQ